MTVVTCAVCSKELQDNEGMVSSTGVVVCSEQCKERFMDTLPNRGESPLTVYSRVTGYYTPVQAWNRGKLREYKERQRYTIGKVSE